MEPPNKRKSDLLDEASTSSSAAKRAKTQQNDPHNDLDENNEAEEVEKEEEDNEELLNILADPYQNLYDGLDDDDISGLDYQEEESDDHDDGTPKGSFQNDKEKSQPAKVSSKASATKNDDEDMKEEEESQAEATVGASTSSAAAAAVAAPSLATAHEDVLKLVMAQLPVADVLKNLPLVCRQLRDKTRQLRRLTQLQVTSVRIDAAYGRRLPKTNQDRFRVIDGMSPRVHDLAEGEHLYHPFASYEQQAEVGERHRLVVRMRRRRHPLPLRSYRRLLATDDDDDDDDDEDNFGGRKMDDEYYEEEVPKNSAGLAQLIPGLPHGSTVSRLLMLSSAEAVANWNAANGASGASGSGSRHRNQTGSASVILMPQLMPSRTIADIMENGERGSQRPVPTASPIWKADPYAWSVLDPEGRTIQSAHRYDMTLTNLPALNNFSHRFTQVRTLTLVNTAVHFLSPHENDEHLAGPIATIWPGLQELHLLGAVLPPEGRHSAKPTLQMLNDLHHLRRLTTTTLRLCDLVEGCAPLLLARLEELNCRLTIHCRVAAAVTAMTTTFVGANLRSLGFLVTGGRCTSLVHLHNQPQIREMVHRLAFRFRITANYFRQGVLEQFHRLRLLDFSIGVADNEYAHRALPEEPPGAVRDNADFSLTALLTSIGERLPELEELIFSYYKHRQKLNAADAEFRLLGTEVRGRPPLRLPNIKRVRAAFRVKLHSVHLLKTVFPGAERIDFVLDQLLLGDAELKRIKCRATVNRCDVCWQTTDLARACKVAKARSVLLPIKRPPGNREPFGQLNFYQHYDW